MHKNDLCNINDEKREIINILYITIGLLGPGDAPPSNAGIREVQLEDLKAGLHKCLGSG